MSSPGRCAHRGGQRGADGNGVGLIGLVLEPALAKRMVVHVVREAAWAAAEYPGVTCPRPTRGASSSIVREDLALAFFALASQPLVLRAGTAALRCGLDVEREPPHKGSVAADVKTVASVTAQVLLHRHCGANVNSCGERVSRRCRERRWRLPHASPPAPGCECHVGRHEDERQIAAGPSRRRHRSRRQEQEHVPHYYHMGILLSGILLSHENAWESTAVHVLDYCVLETKHRSETIQSIWPLLQAAQSSQIPQ